MIRCRYVLRLRYHHLNIYNTRHPFSLVYSRNSLNCIPNNNIPQIQCQSQSLIPEFKQEQLSRILQVDILGYSTCLKYTEHTTSTTLDTNCKYTPTLTYIIPLLTDDRNDAVFLPIMAVSCHNILRVKRSRHIAKCCRLLNLCYVTMAKFRSFSENIRY